METLSFLQIEPTTRCNFTCGFCAGRSMKQSDLDLATFTAAIADFPSLKHIELQGEGESFMHPRFFDMITLARSKGIKVSFITNGSLLGPESIARLLDLGIEKISVSLESADAATFQQIRGGKLDKVVRGIEALLAARRQRGLDRPVVAFSITVLKQTQDHLADILALYKRLGLDGGITLQPLQRMESYTKSYDQAMSAEQLSDEEVEYVWMNFLASKEVRGLQAAKAHVAGFFDELMLTWGPGKRACPWLDHGMFVNRDGDATPCCMVKDTERFGYGRVGRDSPESILGARAALREELGRGVIPAACGGCELAKASVLTKPQLIRLGMRGLWHRWFGKLKPRTVPAAVKRWHGTVVEK